MEPYRIVAARHDLAADASDSATLVIHDGTLIDGTGAAPSAPTSVFISGDRITRINTGPVSIPSDAEVINALGLTIMPGLIDAHAHAKPRLLPLFLRFGVTTIRDLGSDPDFILRAREQEQRGELVSPRIVTSGPFLDGDPPTPGTEWAVGTSSLPLGSVEQARAVAESLVDRGVDWLKVFCGLTPDLVGAVAEVARERGVPVAANLQFTSARDAVKLGVRSIEHTSGVGFFSLTARERRSLIDVMVENGTYLVPTLHVWENLATLPTIGNAAYPNIDLVPEGRQQSWLGWRDADRVKPIHFGARQETAAARRDFVRLFHESGGKVVAGTDTPAPFVVPGASLHDELALLVATGLSPLEAIHAATGLAAELLDRPDLGTVEVGRLADLVLVAGDPAKNISATREIRHVVKGGVTLL